LNLGEGYKKHVLEGLVHPYLFDGCFAKVTWNGRRLITPNLLSTFRFLALFGVAAYVTIVYQAYLTAFWLMLAAVIMDFIDGALARYWGMITKFGAYFDPFVDKVSIIFFPQYGAWEYQGASWENPSILLVTAITLTVVELVLFCIAIIKLLIDLFGLRWYVEKDGSNDDGKTKMVVESIVALLTLLAMKLSLNLDFVAPLYWVAIYYAVKSIIGHLKSIKRRTIH